MSTASRSSSIFLRSDAQRSRVSANIPRCITNTAASYPRRAFTSTPATCLPKSQSFSPLHSVGVDAAPRAASDPSFRPAPTLLQKEYSLTNRVAIVTGAHQGLGLEMVEALAVAGVTVYCLDLFAKPDAAFRATQTCVDVTDQQAVWDLVEKIVEKEGRMDVCVATAGILRGRDCLEYPAEESNILLKVNVNGVFHTAQAAGRQMDRLGTKGSISLIASMSGSITNRGQDWVAYNMSKSTVPQMAHGMVWGLGPKGIRINSLSPGYICTASTHAFLHSRPDVLAQRSNQNPPGRLGRPDDYVALPYWFRYSCEWWPARMVIDRS